MWNIVQYGLFYLCDVTQQNCDSEKLHYSGMNRSIIGSQRVRKRRGYSYKNMGIVFIWTKRTVDLVNMLYLCGWVHYSDVVMGAMASQTTSLTILWSTVYSGADKKNINDAPRHWPLCGEVTSDLWILRTNGQLCEKWFHLMMSSWTIYSYHKSHGLLTTFWISICNHIFAP